nr:methyltransferase domain-containing protein [Tepidiforma sp.]
MNVLRPTEEEALAAWAALVAADAEQVARVREPEPPADHYGAIAHRFRPGALESLEWPVLDALIAPGETVLDIGAGGGRFAVPLAKKGCRVVAIEPSEAMRRTLTAAADEAGVAIEVHGVRWPAAGWRVDADVSLAAHACYDIGEIGPFSRCDGAAYAAAVHRGVRAVRARRSAGAAVRSGARRTDADAAGAEGVHGAAGRAEPAVRGAHGEQGGGGGADGA